MGLTNFDTESWEVAARRFLTEDGADAIEGFAQVDGLENVPDLDPRAQRMTVIVRALAAIPLALAFALTACGDQGFRCGTHSQFGEGVQYCALAEEVCICATHSCAVPVEQGANAKDCKSGWVYVGSPFAALGLEHECVEEEHAPKSGVTIPGGAEKACIDTDDSVESDTSDTSTTDSDTTDTTEG